MAAHSIWTGSISFGLVTIPVSLRTAVEEHDLKFTMLDKRDHAPIGYQHINKKTRHDVKWEDIVKGYEYEPGKYVVVTPEDFRKANVKANQLLEIEDFVQLSEVEATYFDKPYYIVPDEQGVKAYELLRRTLARTGRIGVGRVVMHGKLHVVAVVPMDDVLLLEVMRFPHEVRPVKSLPLPKSQSAKQVSEREVKMAEQLVAGMTSRWDPDKYKDTYHDDLLRLIEKKIRLGDTEEVEPYNEPPAELTGKTKVVDLMPLLKASLSRGRAASSSSSRRPASVTPIEKARRKRATAGAGRSRTPAKSTSKSASKTTPKRASKSASKTTPKARTRSAASAAGKTRRAH